MRIALTKKRVSRSLGGDIFIFLLLGAMAAFMAVPMIFAISNAFKPLNEFFLFPPRLFVRHPTLDNFVNLFAIMAESWIPISRYFLNSVIIVVFGAAGNVLFASLAAYALSKHKFPGAGIFMGMIVLSLMFAKEVTAIPNYVTIATFGWINSYLAVIVPSWGSTLGLYLMKKFMDAMINESLLEAARLDGASEFRIFWQIAMPIVKPAWLTMVILLFQELWKTTGGNFLYSEELKTLPFALDQIVHGGIARQGVGAAVILVMMLIPIAVFLINQSRIIETMGTSGMAN